MGNIQVRLTRSQFQKRMAEFLGKKLSVVFTNNTTSFGNLESISADAITLKNMRLGLKRYLVTDINEVYFDKNA